MTSAIVMLGAYLGVVNPSRETNGTECILSQISSAQAKTPLLARTTRVHEPTVTDNLYEICRKYQY